jgi:uncharacterized protein with HEPN domain
MMDYSREAVELTKDKTQEDLGTERILDLALLHLITMIGEAANRIPSEFQEDHSEIPWAQIVGMRNRLVHEYDEINYDTLWSTVTEDLPTLISQLEKIVPPEETE